MTPMDVGVPREVGDTRVAATPRTVARLRKLGHHVFVESGAGLGASITDDAYREVGGVIVGNAWNRDIVLALGAPTDTQLLDMRPGSTLISFLAPAQDPSLIRRIAAQGVNALSMDMVPHTQRARTLDATGSLANIRGYRAVIEAAHAFGRFLTAQVTATGKVPPANVLVIGTGVAGLAAIGAATSLGAVVRAADVRSDSAEQVAAMGATFLHVEGAGTGGQAAHVAESYATRVREADIVITTVAVPGEPSPRLITAEMVASMRDGSVIVDLAAAGGGNCELTRLGENHVTGNGVTIIGHADLSTRMPGQASQLYGTNLVNLLGLMTPGRDGNLVIDLDDEVVRTMTVALDGEVTFPPPDVPVSADPVPAVADGPAAAADPVGDLRPWWHQVAWAGAGAVALIALLTFVPSPLVGLTTVLVLAIVAGYHVVRNITHALHAPLTSITNAIAGIIVVGAMTQLTSDNWVVRIIASVAVLIASISVFGGFTATHRMLNVFRKG